MAVFELRDVEFASDGVVDSLTLSMAPALFHEALKREVSTAKREERDLVMLTISLNVADFLSVAEFQEMLIKIAFALKVGIRGGDFYARVSDKGFWVLLRTAQSNSQLVIERLELPRHETLVMQTVAREDRNYAEWIDEIDRLYFS